MCIASKKQSKVPCSQNCVEYKNRCWNDKNCVTRLKYICQKPPRTYEFQFVLVNKCQKKPKGKSRMDNPEKLITQSTQDEGNQSKNTQHNRNLVFLLVLVSRDLTDINFAIVQNITNICVFYCIFSDKFFSQAGVNFTI